MSSEELLKASGLQGAKIMIFIKDVMRFYLFRFIVLSFLVAVLICSSNAQESKSQSDEIDAKFRAETIDAVLQLLKEKYVYPEIAVKMDSAIREKLKKGEYDPIRSGNRLAENLTADLRGVFDDKHLRMSYSAKPIPENSSMAGAPSAEEIAAARARQRRENFGLQKAEILKGNVGLLQINYFAPLDWAADAYTAALNTVANADALIVDARANRGSMDINTIPFFCSYLFAEPVQFGDITWRETGENRQLWTYAAVPGKKFLDKPVYILTSGRTSSGAEAFVSHLKRLKRAVIVGETTSGATMPGRSHRVNEHFSIWISIGRGMNALAKDENKGIVPDIQTDAENALNIAHQRALEQIMQTSTDETWKAELKSIISSFNNQR